VPHSRVATQCSSCHAQVLTAAAGRQRLGMAGALTCEQCRRVGCMQCRALMGNRQVLLSAVSHHCCVAISCCYCLCLSPTQHVHQPRSEHVDIICCVDSVSKREECSFVSGDCSVGVTSSQCCDFLPRHCPDVSACCAPRCVNVACLLLLCMPPPGTPCAPPGPGGGAARRPAAGGHPARGVMTFEGCHVSRSRSSLAACS